MKKVLLIGRVNAILKDLYDFLDKKNKLVTTLVCTENPESVKSILKIIAPNLIIISLIGLDKAHLKIFAEIRLKYENIPVLCMGTELEQETFEAFLETEQFSAITRPCTNRKIWYFVKGMLDIKESLPLGSDEYDGNDEEKEVKAKAKTENVKKEAEDNSPRVVKASDDFLEIKFDNDTEAETGNWLEEKLAANTNVEIISIPDEPAYDDVANRRIRVLLVDDNAIQLRALRTVMMKDYDVMIAISGEEALDIMMAERPDIVLLDYNMPGYNGKQVLERIRQSEIIKNIPVVFLAAMQDKKIIIDLLKMKPDGYLVKPPNIEQINETIRKLVR